MTEFILLARVRLLLLTGQITLGAALRLQAIIERNPRYARSVVARLDHVPT